MFTLSTEKSYHRGNLREALIQTGLDVISEQGVRGLTLREIGTRLNVSRMAAYRHFADKSALLSAITAVGFEKFTAALTGALQEARDDFESQSEALAIAYVRFSLQHRAHFEVMFGGGGEPQYLDEEGRRVAYKSFLVLEDLIRKGQGEGAVISGDATEIAQMVWSTVHGMSVLKIGMPGDGQPWNPDLTVRFARLLRIGLSPR